MDELLRAGIVFAALCTIYTTVNLIDLIARAAWSAISSLVPAAPAPAPTRRPRQKRQGLATVPMLHAPARDGVAGGAA
jgi:hypothetical protein